MRGRDVREGGREGREREAGEARLGRQAFALP